jgi:hypothetical protein
MDLREKGDVLRTYESLCYQITYFLLQNEAAATKAGLLTLEELLWDASFFTFDVSSQKEQLKRVAMRYCLRLKRDAAVIEDTRATVEM